MVTYYRFESDSPFAKPFMIVLIAIIAAMVIYVLIRWIKDKTSPKIVTPAKIVFKRAEESWSRSRSTTPMHRLRFIYMGNLCYITFRMENGKEKEFYIRKEAEYERLHEGDTGTLTYRGTHCISFEKDEPDKETENV